MTTIKNGGPAFPWCGDLNDCPTINLGMTLRDYFAAKAIQGLLARQFTKDERDRPFVEWVVEFSFEIADAMIVARGAA
ncbi:MAG: hypothetical protein J0I36_20050 [Pandoraea sp.]|uniref:hypothetical protein n=1 Tax=Pandoraea sp. 64-18 TaxID=1895806 RepID=UPI000968B6CE|nr:hypothetical protein [Pandoraea sp. 64-18]MBN9117492.1 hypothetical protein [Pandoraea sp.]OJY23568.1 MAG: hypothetical protein BGP02_04675 [Pandoraea sp. 64-18]